MIEKEGKPTGVLSQKGMKEAVSWRQSVKWMGGTDLSLPDTERGDPPLIFKDPTWCEEFEPAWAGEKVLLTVDRDPGNQVLFVDREHQIRWKFGELGVAGSDRSHLNNPLTADYHPGKDYVLIADSGNGRVLEVDRETKAIVTELTGFNAGAFGTVRARYDLQDATDRILVVDEDNHYAAEMGRDGKEYWTFGTYGSSGSGDTDLNSPRGINSFYLQGRHMIGDKGNHQVKEIGSDGSFLGGIWLHDARLGYVNRSIRYHWTVLSSTAQPMLVLERGKIMNRILPMAGRNATITDHYTVLFRRHGQLWEVDLRSLPLYGQRNTVVPKNLTVFNTKSLNANETTRVIPFLGAAFSSVEIAVKPTEDITLEILALKPPYNGISKGDWYTQDSVSVTGGNYRRYVPTKPQGMMGVRVTMGSTAGDVSLWLFQK